MIGRLSFFYFNISQINAFKYNVSSIASVSARHPAAGLLLTVRLILVNDQERMQFLLLFCRSIICPPALDTLSHKLVYAASGYTKMVVGF